ncbi:MAG: 3-hydroxyacyl-[acyl-carrier-protein] dehydratase FabZ [Deltaproteobacteria bacterium]|nr:3-hydroxyacyl-[acyl-carrier-protein] dehydratase FabZ [Deltaproteobacteria bacterium]HCH62140.1 3-hydroxyacyl-[acyl-carrier-protein] dehydratase FabZ [Deltaproteobacteria bacterium]
MDAARLLELLPHRWPFVLIDRVDELVPGERALGRKCVTATEPWFAGHFPSRPVFPGVLMTEAFAQLACVVAMAANPDARGRDVYLLGVDKMRFRKPVVPGDVVILTVEVLAVKRGIWKFRAAATVDSQRVAEGELLATVADR